MDFSKEIIAWYRDNKRDLPWRRTTSVYYIWLSEIILQQTRVAQGLSYYNAFIKAFPNVEDLANASEDEVLKLWQGLGYYSRARNLHSAAKCVVNELNGEFPKSFKGLKQLKGVGDYTAAAIASFCYKEAVAVVDGNVYRVLSRYFDVDIPIDSNEGKKYFQNLANELLSMDNPDVHNQAIMEFGALQCTPAADCQNCPLQNTCLSYAKGLVKERPIKNKKIKQVVRHFNYLVISDKEACLMEKREGKGIWQNLYQFPLVESTNEIVDQDKLNISNTDWAFKTCVTAKKHVLSHQIIMAKFWEFETTELEEKSGKVVGWDSVGEYAVPRLIENYLKKRR